MPSRQSCRRVFVSYDAATRRARLCTEPSSRRSWCIAASTSGTPVRRSLHAEIPPGSRSRAARVRPTTPGHSGEDRVVIAAAQHERGRFHHRHPRVSGDEESGVRRSRCELCWAATRCGRRRPRGGSPRRAPRARDGDGCGVAPAHDELAAESAQAGSQDDGGFEEAREAVLPGRRGAKEPLIEHEHREKPPAVRARGRERGLAAGMEVPRGQPEARRTTSRSHAPYRKRSAATSVLVPPIVTTVTFTIPVPRGATATRRSFEWTR